MFCIAVNEELELNSLGNYFFSSQSDKGRLSRFHGGNFSSAFQLEELKHNSYKANRIQKGIVCVVPVQLQRCIKCLEEKSHDSALQVLSGSHAKTKAFA